MPSEPDPAIAELLTLIHNLPDNQLGKTPDTPIAIQDLPAKLQRPEVLRVAEREEFAQGVVWYEGSPTHSERRPDGTIMFAVGTSAGWSWHVPFNRPATHIQLLRKGWAWLDKRSLAVMADCAAVVSSTNENTNSRNVFGDGEASERPALRIQDTPITRYFVATLDDRDLLGRVVQHHKPDTFERYKAVESLDPNAREALVTAALEEADRQGRLQVLSPKIDRVNVALQALKSAAVTCELHSDRWSAADTELNSALNDLSPYAKMARSADNSSASGQLAVSVEYKERLSSTPTLPQHDVPDPANVPQSQSEHEDTDGEATRNATEQQYSVSKAQDMTTMSPGTLNKYAKLAGVPTPGRGRRDHCYSKSELIDILTTAIGKASSKEQRKRYEDARDGFE